MTQLLLHNARVILENGVQRGGVLVRDGRIAAVFGDDDTPAGVSVSDSVDLAGAYLAPGLIDIHIHGSAGIDVQAADDVGLSKLSEFLLANGVTGYFATFVPAGEREYCDAVSAISSYTKQQNDGARNEKSRVVAHILGIHFEGPFVSEHRCGALHREHFRSYDGDPRSLDLFVRGASDGARLITLAPEIPGGLDLARELSSKGVRVFVGHTQADPAILDLAIEAGARHITHFPNALDPLHHRKPGAVAWGLLRDEVTLDCIVDFHHVDPLMLELIYQSKTANRMALISDAIMPTGLGDGEFSVWGDEITVRKGRTSLAQPAGEGTIAGSVITMRQALKNIVSIGIPVHEAVGMASAVPARVAGLGSDYGSIKEGMRADLAAFNDQFEIKLAIVGGAAVPCSN